MASRVEILGTVEVVAGLGNRIYSFFSSVKDAPEEVRQMCSQLQLLQKLFPEIGRSISDLLHAAPLILDIILVCLKGCESEFRAMWLVVEPLRTDRGIIWKDALDKIVTSFKWVLKTEEFEKLIGNLERVKQTLALAMLLAGMRVDSSVLEGLSSIDTKLDEYGQMLDSHLHNVHMSIAFRLEQFEYRFLQRVGVISEAAAEIQGQSSQRVTELYDRITLGRPPQSDESSAVQSLDSGKLDGSAVENQRADTASQAMQDIEVDESVSATFRDIVLERVTFIKQHKYRRITELKIPKWADRLKGIFTNIGRLLNMPSNGSEYSTLIYDGVLAIEASRLSWEYEYYTLLNDILGDMLDAFETCAREYELYPEPRLRNLITSLINESFSRLTNVLQILNIDTSWRGKLVWAKHHRRIEFEDWDIFKDRMWEEYQKERLEVLKESVGRFKKPFRKVMNEVEYLHRMELRQAHLRLREIDRKQDQVIQALKEQQKILSSLQEEKKALSLINNHQKVLQMLQQLLAKFPPPATVGASVGVPINADTSTVSG